MPLTISNVLNNAAGPTKPNPFSGLLGSSKPFNFSAPTTTNTSTPALPGGLNAALSAPPAPAKPASVIPTPPLAIKSSTINSDGSHTVSYYDPSKASPAPAPTPAPNAQTGGFVNAQGQYVNPYSPNPLTGAYGAAVGGLLNTQNSTDLQRQAKDIADAAGQKISDIGGQGAKGTAGYLSTGTSPVAEGNAQLLQNSISAQQQAVAQGAQTQLAGVEKGLEAQGLNQSALNAAGGLATPVQVPYNNQFVNPLTGTSINPQAAQGMNDAVALQVQKIQNGTTDPASAASALSAYGQAGVNALQQALGPNFNLNIAAGTAGAQSNVAGTQAQTVEQYKSALQQGQNLQSQLSDLITTFGLNPNDVNAANSGLQLIAQNTSSPQYKILNNYVNDIANTYAQILTPAGGSQTDTTRGIASSMLDATAKGTSILDVMKSLDQAAQAKIAGTQTLTGSNTNTGASGGKISAGGYNFALVNGKWVPQ